jgi:hypothetical protein
MHDVSTVPGYLSDGLRLSSRLSDKEALEALQDLRKKSATASVRLQKMVEG